MGRNRRPKATSLAEPGAIGFTEHREPKIERIRKVGKTGIFTKALIDGLKGQAADADGNITLDGLQRYIRETVGKPPTALQMPIFENQQGNYILRKESSALVFLSLFCIVNGK